MILSKITKLNGDESMVRSLLKLILVFSLVSVLPSCSITPDAMEMLDRSMRSYERTFRWGDFDGAKAFHKNESTLSELKRRRLKLYRVTGYDTLQSSILDRYNAISLVEIKYIKIDRQVIKSIRAKLHWKRDKETNAWYIDSRFPMLK